MAKKTDITPEETESTVTLQEFLNEIPDSRVEMKGGFKYLCKAETITGSKTRTEWQSILDKYNTKPDSITWADWNKGGE